MIYNQFGMMFGPKTYLMLVGLPCTGKSTFFDKVLADHARPPNDFKRVSTDDLIEQHAARVGKTYSEVFQSCIKNCTAEMEANRHIYMLKGYNICHDQTNLTSFKRVKTLETVFSDYYKVCVVFPTPKNHAEILADRARETGKHIPNDAIYDMKMKFEVPTIEEGWNCIQFLPHSWIEMV